METREFSVNMGQLDAHRIEAGSLEIESVVLTPAQWPMEASIKNLFQGDFVGIINNFDLSFRSSRLRSDTHRRLFDAGYIPAFLRVRNTSKSEAEFNPNDFVVHADSDTNLYAVSAESLPERFTEIDWESTTGNPLGVPRLPKFPSDRTGMVITALVVVLVVANSKEGMWSRGGSARMLNSSQRQTSAAARPSDEGLLRARLLKPGEIIEGFVFFQMDQTVADWTSARIEILP